MSSVDPPDFQWRVVGTVTDLKGKKCSRLYTESGNDLAIFCVHEEEFYIATASCPHANGPLDQGDIEESDGCFKIVCPVHSYSFDLKTGVSSSGLKMETFETEIRDGQLYVKFSEPVYLKPVKK